MPVYMVDASVVIEYLITGIYTSYARALFDQEESMDRFVVPEFGLLECANVLWKQVRFQGMPASRAEVLLLDLRKMPLKRVPTKAALYPALRIALKHQLAVYDSVYIALALRSRISWITID
jgi:predicted nucleic acid-binding protein